MRTGRAVGVGLVLATGLLAAPAARGDELRTGIALYQEGKYADAEPHLRQATGAEASAYLAGSLAKQKKFADAEAPAKAALAEQPAHEVAAGALGESLVGQKKYDEAVERMNTALKAKGDLAYAYYWRGQAYYNKRQADKMVSDFEAFLRLAPKAPEAATVQQLLAGLR
jgi:tetratricopeptide (TPR) repeat protein